MRSAWSEFKWLVSIQRPGGRDLGAGYVYVHKSTLVLFMLVSGHTVKIYAVSFMFILSI